jgi:hypothetical protein
MNFLRKRWTTGQHQVRKRRAEKQTKLRIEERPNSPPSIKIHEGVILLLLIVLLLIVLAINQNVAGHKFDW